MIVCHEHKFVFLKTRKTAGTSVEVALTQLCGPDDIVTPISPRDEPLREAFGGPRNHRGHFNPLPELAVPQTDITRTIRDAWRGRKFFNHMTAAQVRNRVPREVWDSYFKFTIERNPWDKMVSRFHWENRAREVPRTWEEFLDRGNLQSDWNVYTLGGKIIVDQVLRFEHLNDDLKAVLAKRGIEGVMDLPNAKGGYRKDPRSYREYYSSEQRQTVAAYFAREIDAFGYEF